MQVICEACDYKSASESARALAIHIEQRMLKQGPNFMVLGQLHPSPKPTWQYWQYWPLAMPDPETIMLSSLWLSGP